MSQWTVLLAPVLSLALLGIGIICLLTRRRLIKQVIGFTIMLQGAIVSLADGGRTSQERDLAQSMIVASLMVETIVLGIALALIINIFRYHPQGRIDDLDSLKG